MRIAVLADIHGNSWALEAVVADARRRGVDGWLDLGDSLYGPLDPAGTADRLMDLPLLGVLGNQDRAGNPPPEAQNPTELYVSRSLTERHKTWLAARPATRVAFDELFLCHGTPRSDRVYLLEEPTPAGGALRGEAAILADLAGVTQAVILCGHSHTPRLVRLADGRLVVNPGSVGLPAYSDDLPCPHKMENGSPYARYAILERIGEGWQVDHLAVPYPWEEAARCADRHDREDWAACLLTGRA